ncbi:MAG: DUF362 domain-containing protein [Candidatus Aminicenantes bacterium]|nr:DUF362 domain-containing protein [Candidatus Aminicenantes bacterium]NIM78189.1 DUF362 domain-containing protein [Candidatus Aminicenantes bacterium]NIN17526.1 DUF362 domain-containing protein [Candidatus Aminicenantes bacterium]NIN41412.1 DUF362 domain-containing protein [Candidatus Aminicenantes bacterium]NIN84178.1 DUF362 domain-containing protein [Candidatus Aminicenantes bacterium]
MMIKKSETKDVNNQRKYNWWWLFPVFGLIALIWYLVRVVPKPSRASYPCQRAAAPLAGGFILWLVGLVGSVTIFRKAGHFFKRSRFGWAMICLIISLSLGIVTFVRLPEEPVNASASQVNAPIGTARGIHPGRVVWAYDPDATDWEGFNSSDHWWESDHTDLAVVEKMISRVIRGVSGESTDAAAWDSIFRYNNRSRGNGDVGYQAGEKITIKLNLVTCIARGNFVDKTTYNKNADVLNRIDTSPQAVLALLRQLVNTVGAAQEDITVGDPTAMFPNCYWNILHPEFPNVHYWDNYGGSGRTRAEFSDVPFYWSTPDADGKVQDYLPEAVVEADYLINFAVLKGHSAGVTLCAKNHYGTLIRCPDGLLRDQGSLDYYNTHLSLPNATWSPGRGHYRSLVDLMGHPEIGDKTVLYLIDGLFAGYYWDAQPVKWISAPFGDGINGDWPSSIFASLDPVAIDSVAYDFLLMEWPNVVLSGGGQSMQGGAEDYLHEAAQADSPLSGTFYDPDRDGLAMSSQGVHEHWNNSTDKLYSRNLGTGDGIELFHIYNITNSPSEIALDRNQLNFAYVIGGSLPGSQTFRIANAAEGTSSWIISESISWLSCTPTCGNNSGLIAVSVNTSAMTAGTYTDTITVTNLSSTGSPLTVQVTLKIYAFGSDSEPFGSFDTPLNEATVCSSVPVTGWALDDVAVESVKIYRDPVSGEGSGKIYIGDAIFVEGARPDVETAYPGYPNNYKAGWGYMMLSNFLPNQGNGTFKLYAVAADVSGNEVTLGTKTIICDNAGAFKPFGAIDAPGQGGTASGSEFINWGWVLTPMPNSIPTDGSTINVYVDGVNIGNPVYNNYRADIAGLFPNYANSNGAVGYFYLDTTAYADGVHTIQWTATNTGGNTDGIGSRYFTIQNTGESRVQQTASRARSKEGRGSTLLPNDFSGPVRIKKGYNDNIRHQRIYPDKKGIINIEIKELERLEIHLNDIRVVAKEQIKNNSKLCAGYLVVGNKLRRLPIGSTLDRERCVFSWQPGPGFFGEYRLVFVTGNNGGRYTKRNVKIRIGPKFQE